MIFTNTNITIATTTDVSAIVKLLNNAYRGESSKKGWTTEAELIAGDVRANAAMVLQGMSNKDDVFLLYKDSGQLIGCVNLQLQEQKYYLGMFAVEPNLQGAGVGKQLLSAAEDYAISKSIKCIYMTVISLRTELIAWYKKHGYELTGKTLPFHEDGISGKHLQALEFEVLEKLL
jgi:ribosomal protein S18 acetylase RimI-like enzyme